MSTLSSLLPWASSVDGVNAKSLNKAALDWFLDKTLNSSADKADPRLDIIHAKLSLLPPVTIINAQIDPLRSDGAMLEEALKQVNWTSPVLVDRWKCVF
jgi:acetyl esterase